MPSKPTTLLRLPSVIERTGRSRTAIYDDMKRGVLPTPVPIGGRAVAWSSDEIDAVINARIAGKLEDEIKQLVTSLVGRRADVYGKA